MFSSISSVHFTLNWTPVCVCPSTDALVLATTQVTKFIPVNSLRHENKCNRELKDSYSFVEMKKKSKAKRVVEGPRGAGCFGWRRIKCNHWCSICVFTCCKPCAIFFLLMQLDLRVTETLWFLFQLILSRDVSLVHSKSWIVNTISKGNPLRSTVAKNFVGATLNCA